MALTISDDDYDEILTPTGFPVIGEADLEVTKDVIKKIYILPAVRRYFLWFPIRIEQQVILSQASFSIDFPRTTTFSVIDTRLSTSRERSQAVTANPLINAQNISIASHRRGMYGTRNDYDMHLVRILENAVRQSTISAEKAFRVRVDENQRKIFGYSNVTGPLSITWADYSEDFGDIAFSRREDVRDLAQSRVLRGFAMIRGQQNSDTPNQFNYDLFLSESERLEEEVMNRWRKMTKPILLRE